MFGFECKELLQVLFICILQLALSTVNADVHGDRDCDSPQHTHSTDEHDLHSGKESRPCGVRCGSYFTTYSYGE